MGEDRPILSTDPPIMRPPVAEPGLMLVQARLVDAVADGAELCGTLDELAARFGVEAYELAAAAEELAAIGWVAISLGTDGTVTMRWVGEGH